MKTYGLKKIIFVFVLLLLGTTLFSCKGLEFENQKLATAKELTKGESMIFIAEEKNKYENKFTSQIWNLKSGDGNTYFKDYIVYTVKRFVERIMKLKLVANDVNVIISSEDDEKLKKAAEDYLNELTFADLSFIDCTDEDVYNAFRDYHISRLVIDNLSKNASDEISISEAKVISVQYIVFNDKDSALKTKEDLKAKGANFAYFAKTRSDDDNIDMIVKRGDENSIKFPELFYLSTGQISDALQYRNKYYLFKCVSDYLPYETELRRLEILRAMKNDEFTENFAKFDEDYRVISNSNYWKDIDLYDGRECKIDSFDKIYYKYFPESIK